MEDLDPTANVANLAKVCVLLMDDKGVNFLPCLIFIPVSIFLLIFLYFAYSNTPKIINIKI